MVEDNNGRETSRPWVYTKGLLQRLLDSFVVLAFVSLMTLIVGWLSQGHLVEILGGVRSEGQDYMDLKKRVGNLEQDLKFK